MLLLLQLLAWFFGLVLWFVFFGTLVRQRMYRRCQEKDGLEMCGLHFLGCVLGYLGGPLAYTTVLIYELADGTVRERREDLRAEAMAIRDSL